MLYGKFSSEVLCVLDWASVYAYFISKFKFSSCSSHHFFLTANYFQFSSIVIAYSHIGNAQAKRYVAPSPHTVQPL